MHIWDSLTGLGMGNGTQVTVEACWPLVHWNIFVFLDGSFLKEQGKEFIVVTFTPWDTLLDRLLQKNVPASCPATVSSTVWFLVQPPPSTISLNSIFSRNLVIGQAECQLLIFVLNHILLKIRSVNLLPFRCSSVHSKLLCLKGGGGIFLAIGGADAFTSVVWRRWIGSKHGNLSVKIVPFHPKNVLYVHDMRMFSKRNNQATTWGLRFYR